MNELGDDRRMRLRLGAMMALIYAPQGAFWPVLAVHLADLGVSERARGWIFGTNAIAALVVPLGVGQLVDRLVPARRYLAGAYAVGALILAALGLGAARSAWGLGLGFLAYWLVLAPCYSLGNALSFRLLAQPEHDFGRVRLWGTVGWMVAGWVVTPLMALRAGPGQGAVEALGLASACSLAAALYCLSLPDTPPVRLMPEGRRTTIGRDVADLLRRDGVAVYFVASFGVSLATPFVYQVMPEYLRRGGMDRAWVTTAMSLGQWPEVIGLALLPILIGRWGYRVTLALGVGAYAVRFVSLVPNPPLWLAVAGIPLHGVGVACFSVAGQMFINARATGDRRASTQALNTVINGGIGSILGSLLAGEVVGRSQGRPGLAFVVPSTIHLGLLILLGLSFRPSRAAPTSVQPRSAESAPRRGGLPGHNGQE